MLRGVMSKSQEGKSGRMDSQHHAGRLVSLTKRQAMCATKYGIGRSACMRSCVTHTRRILGCGSCWMLATTPECLALTQVTKTVTIGAKSGSNY